MTTFFKALATAVFATAFIAAPIYAQNSTLRADSGTSVGRIFLTSAEKPQLEVNLGVTRVSGEVSENGSDAVPKAIRFTLYPADQQSAESAKKADSTIIAFRSKNIQKIDDDTYRANGELAVTYVVRVANYDPTEAFSGAAYSQSSMYTVKHEATFDFHPVHHAATENAAAYTDWATELAVAGHYFPELMQAVSKTSWPMYVNNEQCSMPTNAGAEDFSGPSCTGDVVTVAARTDVHCTPGNIGAEDFSGEVCTGTPLIAPSTPEQATGAVQIVETNNHTNSVIADEVKLVLNLHVNDATYSIAGNSSH